MSKLTYKYISLLLCLLLCLQQSSFAQVAVELNIASHLSALHNSLVTNKFRPVHLRYLQYEPQSNNFQLLLDKGDSFSPRRGHFPSELYRSSSKESVTEQEDNLKEETKTLLKYFFIGLTLPNDTFWVNLRPDSPDQIIDDKLAETDIGKIMLETDLQLKKDTASFTSPQTAEGREYWDKLYKKAEELYGSENVIIPTLTRPWIVPGEIIVRESQGTGYGVQGSEKQENSFPSAYIYKATLKVMLEEDYLKSAGCMVQGASDYSFKDERAKELNEYSTQLIRELIIPKLTKEVNSSKRYASLRQVYYSLIMAQWFKARAATEGDIFRQSYNKVENRKVSPVINLINSQNLTNLTSKQEWDKDIYFQAYKKSFTEGEYNFREPVYTPTGQVIRSYFSGGEMLTGASSAMVIIPATSSSALFKNDDRFYAISHTAWPAASSAEKIETSPDSLAGSPVTHEDPLLDSNIFMPLALVLQEIEVDSYNSRIILDSLAKTPNPKDTVDSFIALISNVRHAIRWFAYVRIIVYNLAKKTNPKEAADRFIATKGEIAFSKLTSALRDMEGVFEEELIDCLTKTPDPKAAADSFFKLAAGIKEDYIRSAVAEKLTKDPQPKETADILSDLLSGLTRVGVSEYVRERIVESIVRLPHPKKNADNFQTAKANVSFAKLISFLNKIGLYSDDVLTVVCNLAKSDNPKESADTFLELSSELKKEWAKDNRLYSYNTGVFIKSMLASLAQSTDPKESADRFIVSGAVSSFLELISGLIQEQKKNECIATSYINSITGSLSNTTAPKESADNFVSIRATSSFTELITILTRAKVYDYIIENVLFAIAQTSNPKATADRVINFIPVINSTEIDEFCKSNVLYSLSKMPNLKEAVDILIAAEAIPSLAKLSLALRKERLNPYSVRLIIEYLIQGLYSNEEINILIDLFSLLKSKNVEGVDIVNIFLSIFETANPREAIGLLFKNKIRFSDFAKVFTQHGFKRQTVSLFLNLPENWDYSKFQDDKLAVILALDEFNIGNLINRDPKDINPNLFKQYQQNPLFFELRYLLKKEKYNKIKILIREQKISRQEIIRAFLLNSQNAIISQTSDLILQYQGTRGILENMTSLAKKIGESRCGGIDLNNLLDRLGLVPVDIEPELREAGFRLYSAEADARGSIIIPIVFDVLLSAYRGSAEYDHLEANYLTHALTTALLHYAIRGGEAGGNEETEPYGANAFHEFDLLWIALEAENERWLDQSVSLAFHCMGKPLPEYARKRTVPLIGNTFSGHIQLLLKQQFKERQAKENILKIFNWIKKWEVKSPEEIAIAINTLKTQLQALENECGLKKEYFEATFGYLNDTFFKDVEGNPHDLEGCLRRALEKRAVVITAGRNGNSEQRIAHPWLAKNINLLDYLQKEEEIRTGTFDETNVSSINLSLSPFGSTTLEVGSAAEEAASFASSAVRNEKYVSSLVLAKENTGSVIESIIQHVDFPETLNSIFSSLGSCPDSKTQELDIFPAHEQKKVGYVKFTLNEEARKFFKELLNLNAVDPQSYLLTYQGRINDELEEAKEFPCGLFLRDFVSGQVFFFNTSQLTASYKHTRNYQADNLAGISLRYLFPKEKYLKIFKLARLNSPRPFGSWDIQEKMGFNGSFEMLVLENTDNRDLIFSPSDRYSQDFQSALFEKAEQIKDKRITIIGPGSGIDVLLAIKFGAASVKAIDISNRYTLLTKWNLRFAQETHQIRRIAEEEAQIITGNGFAGTLDSDIYVFNTPSIRSASEIIELTARHGPAAEIFMPIKEFLALFNELKIRLLKPGTLGIWRILPSGRSGLVELNQEEIKEVAKELMQGQHQDDAISFAIAKKFLVNSGFIPQESRWGDNIFFLENPRVSSPADRQKSDSSVGEEIASSASPAEAVGVSFAVQPVGGIDFRSLPIVTKAMTNLSANLRDSPLRGQSLTNVNLDDEWQNIEKMASSGIKPSAERIKEYAQASSALGKIGRDRDKIIRFIFNIWRDEEVENCRTSLLLLDIVVILESVQQLQQLEEAFLGKPA